MRSDERNSRGSDTSRVVSKICRSRPTCASWARLASPSLYFQCAAIPFSAMRSISRVRIWTSNGTAPSGTSVVWRDW